MKRKIGNSSILAAAGMILAAGMTITAYGGEWKQDENGFWWQNDDGSFAASGWYWLDGNRDGIQESYYFDQNGYMLASQMTPDNYFVNENGAWTVDGVIQTRQAAPVFKEKINTVIWDLMDHTGAENDQKYGKALGKASYGGYMMTVQYGAASEELRPQDWPNIIYMSSEDVPLDQIFLDAPDPAQYHTLEEITAYLENLGYEVTQGHSLGLSATPVCYITVDRFDIAFAGGPGESVEMRIRQPMTQTAIEDWNMWFNTPLATPAGEGGGDSSGSQIIRMN